LQVQAGTKLLTRALLDAGDSLLMAAYPITTHFLFISWVKARGRASLPEYLHRHVSDEAALLQLVRAFSPIVNSSSRIEPYVSNFYAQRFHSIRKLFGPIPLEQLLSPAHQETTKEFPSEGSWQPADDDLLLYQFSYWCRHPPIDVS
jgi:hypothetical protein